MGLAGLWLVRISYVRTGLLFALAAAISACLYAGYLNRGINNLAMTVLPVIVVFAGFLLDRTIILGCASMASLGIVAMQWLRWQEGRGTMSASDIGIIATFSLTIALSATAGYLMASRLNRALRDLRESEERWQLALLGSNDGIWDWNPITNELFVSSRWKSMLGFDDADLAGTAEEWRSLVHPEDLNQVEEASRRHLEAHSEHFSSEFRMRTKGGQYRWILSRGRAWRDDSGKAIRMVGSHKDITEHRDALAKAEAASRAKSEFLANLSHEIRTPMNAVLGYAELLRGSSKDEDRREYLRELTATAGALQELLSHMLDLSRLESGKLSLTSAPFKVRDLVEGTLALFRGIAREREVALHVSISEATPEAVRGDEARIRQVLMNLVGNAVKFTHGGGVGIEVDHLVKRKAGLQFRVWDDGDGIPEAARDRIFEPFFQADASETRKHGGIGLGLAIVKRLIVQMDGEIELEGGRHNGTAFRFFVPLESCPSPKLQDGAALSEFGSIEQRSARVLLVEDNAVNQKIATRLLERHAHSVRIAASGKEALRAAQEERFDLILMDLHMPEMNGAEAAEAIRRSEGTSKRTPIWALTAAASDEERLRCKEAGMDGFLTKPIEIGALLRVVDQALADAMRP
jgi:PAS domain S-box-containing protein